MLDCDTHALPKELLRIVRPPPEGVAQCPNRTSELRMHLDEDCHERNKCQQIEFDFTKRMNLHNSFAIQLQDRACSVIGSMINMSSFFVSRLACNACRTTWRLHAASNFSAF